MVGRAMSTSMSGTPGPIPHIEPNRRQQLALERIEFAVGELATVLLSSCPSQSVADAAVRDIRRAVSPAIREILGAD
jgi:hypothetical protein